jgi:hypothetical protein
MLTKTKTSFIINTMIPTEVYIEYLRNQLANQKTLYDYLQIILPTAIGIILAIGGWIFAYSTNKSMFKREMEKEQYYKSKESAVKITSLFFEFENYCYSFINKIKNIFDSNGEFIENDLTTFSYEKLLKLSYVFSLIKIEFPTIKINETEIHNASNNIEEYFYKLKLTDKNLILKNNDLYIEKISDANNFIENTINQLFEDINSIEEEINIFLKNNAKKLKIT